jgi:hypothetical protein
VSGWDPRYLNLRVATPFFVLDLVRSGQVVLTEGSFDWWSTVRWGVASVALLGTRVSRSGCRPSLAFDACTWRWTATRGAGGPPLNWRLYSRAKR